MKKGLFCILTVLLVSSMASAGGMDPVTGKGLKPGSATGTVEVGGYADVLFENFDDTKSAFALGHFCLNLTAELYESTVVGAELEWARSQPMVLNASEDNGALVAGYVDYMILEPIKLRAGKFLVPMNVYNTKVYPADVAKLAAAPLMNEQIIPSKWAETGLQISGLIDTGSATELNYSAYYVNGLETEVDEDGVIDDSIADMKNNDVEVNDSDKAIGGRIGVVTPGGFEIGMSGYSGAYTPDGKQDLTMLGLDVCYGYEMFEVRGEYVKADLDSAVNSDQDGYYIQGAYAFLDNYEVVVRYDEADVDVTSSANERFTLGGNYTVTDDLTFRLSYEWNDSSPGDGIVGQLAVRF